MELDLKNIELGVATAATQIEGGDSLNSWQQWADCGHIIDGTHPNTACSHEQLYESDTFLMAGMGIKVYRMGIEWAKIEPSQGKFNEAAIERYIDEIKLISGCGIKILLTLHHFTNPKWFEDMGAFENEKCVDIFCNFVEYVVNKLGDLINEYVTINEPNVYVTNGYMFGTWPPGVKSLKRVKRVMSNLCACHIKAYSLIHRIRQCKGYEDTAVGVANHIRIFRPLNPLNPVNKLTCVFAEKYFQRSITLALHTGIFKGLKKPKGIEQGKYYDFIGINYYTRSTMSGLNEVIEEGAPVNDLNWEIYPLGLNIICREMYKRFNAPIYITENGTADSGDVFRSRFIYEHLKAAIDSGADVRRYYHWTFYDNFEWLEGFTARFGLVEANPANERAKRSSAEFYTDMIKNNGVTESAYEKYIAASAYNEYKSGNKEI